MKKIIGAAKANKFLIIYLLISVYAIPQTLSQDLGFSVNRGINSDKTYKNILGFEFNYTLRLPKSYNFKTGLSFEQSTPDLPDTLFTLRSLRSVRLHASLLFPYELDNNWHMEIGPQINYFRTELHEKVISNNPDFKRVGLAAEIHAIYNKPNARFSWIISAVPGWQIRLKGETSFDHPVASGSFPYVIFKFGFMYFLKKDE